jgi:hypothetical protein
LEIQGKQTDPKHRLLIVGDSFIVRRTSVAQWLPRRLEAHGVAVLNLATGGTGPFEYLDAVKSGSDFKPDIVLLSYYVGNDLTNVQNHPRFANRGGEASGLAINSSSTRPFFRHFYIYHYALRKWQDVRSRWFDYGELRSAGIPADLIEDAKASKINPWLLALAARQKNYFLDNVLMERGENLQAWQKTKELLAEAIELCKKRDAQLVMVIFPASVQINDSHFEFLKRLKFNLDRRTLESTAPQRLLMQLCAEQGIRCLDLLPPFRARKNEEFYREKDDHLNDEGNRLAGELIFDFLVANTVIGRRSQL